MPTVPTIHEIRKALNEIMGFRQPLTLCSLLFRLGAFFFLIEMLSLTDHRGSHEVASNFFKFAGWLITPCCLVQRKEENLWPFNIAISPKLVSVMLNPLVIISMTIVLLLAIVSFCGLAFLSL